MSIKTDIVLLRQGSPKIADIAFCSIAHNGVSGPLNEYVRKELGHSNHYLPSANELKSGACIVSPNGLKPIIYVVSVNSAKNSLELLQENLNLAFKKYADVLENKKVWIPLMGTGYGNIPFETSLKVILQNIEMFDKYGKPKEILISIPNEVSNDEYEQYVEYVTKLFLPIKTKSDFDNSNETFDYLNEFKGSFFAVGSNWSEAEPQDQTSRFLNGGIWEIGDEKLDYVVRQVKPNDILVLKSTYPGQGTGYLRIKYLGKVVENLNDGRRLKVKWIYDAKNTDIPGRLSKLRHRIAEISKDDYIEIIHELGNIDKTLKTELYSSKFKTFSQKETNLSNDSNIESSSTTSADAHNVSNDINSIERQSENNTLTKLTRSEAISTDYGSKDSLGFTKDVQSLAALIALKEMKPPLAIALFGNWGSGKSFFMDSLEQRIRELSKYQGFIEEEGDLREDNEDEVFLNGIAHIKFNAWSYMDANLWAGLAHSLFEKLDQYITDNTKGDIERAKVHKQINEHLEYLSGNQDTQITRLRELNKKKIQLEKEREHKLLEWFKPKYDVRIRAFLKHNGMDKDELEHYLPSKLRKHVEKSVDFVNYLKGNGYQLMIWILGIIAVIWVLKVTIVPIIPEFLSYLKSIWTYVSLTIATPLVVFARYVIKYKKHISSLLMLSEEEENLKNESFNSYEQDKIKQEIQKANDSIIMIENKIVQEEHSKQNLNDRAIENLISEIPIKDDYVKHLGIITTIRRDFETLSDLFSYRDKEINETLSEKEKQRIEELNQSRNEIEKAFEKNRKLNRIVLYIDDLDRCSDEKVLEVLQAVHLLMAFPLFTVVVGVDERSVHNALKYQQLKRYQNIDKELVIKNIKEIEPREYLEKIFQIPFQLPDASDDGVEQLINDIIPSPEYESSGQSDDTQMGDVQMGDSEMIERGMSKMPNEKPDIEDFNTIGETNADYLRLTKTIKPEEIRITSKEKEYLQLFSPLVGNNPRTVKRYINIFRIVKTHELNIFTEADFTLKVVFLIAFYTGKHRVVAVNFLKLDHDLRLNAYLSNTAGEAKEKSEEGKLLLLIESMQHKELGVKQILNMPKTDHLKLFSFIERFSYKLDSQI